MLDKKIVVDNINIVMRKLFGVEPGWHRELDIVKNNYALARSYIAAGKYRDALFRLKLLLWLDPKHKTGLLDLARTYIALDKLPAANKALAQLLALDAHHAEAKKLKAAIASGKVSIAPALEVAQEMDAKPLHFVHKESFPLYWKESEISDMLMTSGTRGWLARMGQPVGMLMTRAQFEQAEILTIAVVPSARRGGIAARLMAEAEKSLVAEGVKKIFLEVAENNAAALALYRRIGYSEVSRRTGYYKQPDGSSIDALVMSKELL